MNAGLEGVLPIDKPAGWTSHDVVAKVRRMLRIRRIGHTGTLDPGATGVLPLCLGRATRLAEYIQERPKAYAAEMTIGYSTDTLDATGTVTEQAARVDLDETAIREAVARYTGSIEQVPPMYSSIKHRGRRLYELAREGREVERKTRRVRIYRIEVEHIDLERAFPAVQLRVLCSKGTYIRTLCADIGKTLGYPAVMSALVRTASGGFTLDQCMTLQEVGQRLEDGTIGDAIVRPEDAVSHMPRLVLPSALTMRAVQGRTLPMDRDEPPAGRTDADAEMTPPETDQGKLLVRLFDESGVFCGIFAYFASDRTLRPEKVFVSGDAANLRG